MYYKNLVIKLIEKCYFDDFEKKENLLYLLEDHFHQYFYQDYETMNYQLKLPNFFNYFRCNMFNFNIITLYDRILEKAYTSELIKSFEYEFLFEKIMNIIDGLYSNINDSEIKIYAILCILKAFNRKLPKVALLKYYFILVKPKIFKAVINKFDELYKAKVDPSIKEKNKQIFFSETLLIPDFTFIAEMFGPYDIDFDDLLKDMEKLFLIEIIYENRAQNTKIVKKGIEFLNQSINNKVYVSELMMDAKELSARFKDWSGHEIEQFLKKYIIKDFTKYIKGEILRY